MKDRPEEAPRQGESWSAVLRAAPVSTLVATFFGVGFLRPFPGTWGSLATLPVAWLVARQAGALGLLALAAAAAAIGIPAASRVARLRANGDPSQVVVDEVAGQSLALAVLAFAIARGAPVALPLPWLLAGFVLFRLFDIAKPGPVRRLEALPGGVGIVMDDVLAGLFAGLLAAGLALLMR